MPFTLCHPAAVLGAFAGGTAAVVAVLVLVLAWYLRAGLRGRADSARES